MKSPRAFTLIELLTVIAIIGILAAILIPVVSKVRESARWSQGMSNIRQVALANLSWASDNNGQLLGHDHGDPASAINYYPAGEGRSWYVMLTNYINNAPLNTQLAGDLTTPILRDPTFSGDFPTNPFHHAFIRTITVRSQPSATQSMPLNRFTNVNNHREPSTQVLVATGAFPHGDIHDNGFGSWNEGNFGTVNRNLANEPVPISDNGPGQIRWKDGRTKVAFLDGHARTVSEGQLQRRHLNPSYTNF
ncbi:MAG: prepilin-type N-terminal cleavage/methylation domain-containing protein [Puniceicoccaceae bacterium]|nr:MAG: prepilin-type N-terminal cleavage/methylation domain-containing protein [Puniceicoccaceae bacterium]